MVEHFLVREGLMSLCNALYLVRSTINFGSVKKPVMSKNAPNNSVELSFNGGMFGPKSQCAHCEVLRETAPSTMASSRFNYNS